MILNPLFFVFALIGFVLSSCTWSGEDKLDPFDNRGKTETRARATQLNSESPDEPRSSRNSAQAERFVFPFLIDKKVSSLTVSSEDNIDIRFSVPSSNRLALLAVYSGRVLVEPGRLVLLPTKPSQQAFHFEFQQESSKVFVQNQSQVEQKKPLLESSQPITFFLSIDGEKQKLCFDLSGVEKRITVHNNLPPCSTVP